jgi:osmoprotectant transport system permease protein
VAGVDGVPASVRDAADGMGYTPMRRFLRVELPLALPEIITGLRVATVTVIGLVTVTALIGHGGLGAFINDGLNRSFSTPIVVGIVGSVLLALVADLVFVVIQHALTPWTRRGRS